LGQRSIRIGRIGSLLLYKGFSPSQPPSGLHGSLYNLYKIYTNGFVPPPSLRYDLAIMGICMSKEAVESRHREFAIEVASGTPQWRAYAMVFQSDHKDSCKASSALLIRKPHVASMIAKLREEAFEARRLSRAEKLAFLADVVRESPADAIGKDGRVKRRYRHLIQEATIIRSPDGTVATKIKFPSKNEAVRIDNNMQGHDGTVKVEGNLTLAMLVPAHDSLEAKDNPEDWD